MTVQDLKEGSNHSMIIFDGGMFGTLHKIITVRENGSFVQFKKRARFSFEKSFNNGAILLNRPHSMLLEHETGSFIMNGNKTRLLDVGGSIKSTLRFYAENTLMHSLENYSGQVLLISSEKPEGSSNLRDRKILAHDFKSLLLDVLPKNEPREKVIAPILTQEMWELLYSRAPDPDDEEGVSDFCIRIVTGIHPASWLLSYAFRDEPGVAWGVADLGMQCVEFGSIGLDEMAEVRGGMFQPSARIIDPKKVKYSLSDLLGMESIPSDVV